MKKKLFFSALSLLTQLLVAGMLPATASEGADAQRVRINTERARQEFDFSVARAACHRKFFVNSCLQELSNRHHDFMVDLRRQEIALNDAERRRKAAEQLRKTEDKISLDRRQDADHKRAEALKDFESLSEREKGKIIARAEALAAEKASQAAAEKRLKANQDKAVARTEKQAAAAGEVARYTARQNEAAERRAQRDQQRLAQSKPSARPLPIPE